MNTVGLQPGAIDIDMDRTSNHDAMDDEGFEIYFDDEEQGGETLGDAPPDTPQMADGGITNDETLVDMDALANGGKAEDTERVVKESDTGIRDEHIHDAILHEEHGIASPTLVPDAVIKEDAQPLPEAHEISEVATEHEAERTTPQPATDDTTPKIPQNIGHKEREEPEEDLIDYSDEEFDQFGDNNIAPGTSDAAFPLVATITDQEALQEPAKADPLLQVIVEFNGTRVPLFPLSSSGPNDSYFLHDEQIAAKSLEDLFKVMREGLSSSVDDEVDLVLSCPAFGVSISEDSKEASMYSLSTLMDLYVGLHELDSVTDVEPLDLKLTKRPKFSFRMEDLLAAVADGRGFSQISYLNQSDEPFPASDSYNDQSHSTSYDEGAEYDVDQAAHDNNQYYGEEGQDGDDFVESVNEQYQDYDAGDHPEGEAYQYQDPNGDEHHGDDYYGDEDKYDEGDEQFPTDLNDQAGHNDEPDSTNSAQDQTNTEQTPVHITTESHTSTSVSNELSRPVSALGHQDSASTAENPHEGEEGQDQSWVLADDEFQDQGPAEEEWNLEQAFESEEIHSEAETAADPAGSVDVAVEDIEKSEGLTVAEPEPSTHVASPDLVKPMEKPGGKTALDDDDDLIDFSSDEDDLPPPKPVPSKRPFGELNAPEDSNGEAKKQRL